MVTKKVFKRCSTTEIVPVANGAVNLRGDFRKPAPRHDVDRHLAADGRELPDQARRNFVAELALSVSASTNASARSSIWCGSTTAGGCAR